MASDGHLWTSKPTIEPGVVASTNTSIPVYWMIHPLEGYFDILFFKAQVCPRLDLTEKSQCHGGISAWQPCQLEGTNYRVFKKHQKVNFDLNCFFAHCIAQRSFSGCPTYLDLNCLMPNWAADAALVLPAACGVGAPMPAGRHGPITMLLLCRFGAFSGWLRYCTAFLCSPSNFARLFVFSVDSQRENRYRTRYCCETSTAHICYAVYNVEIM